MLRGIRARAQELGWEVATVSANEDKLKQINGVQDLVARGVKGILISPIDAVGVNAAYDAAEAGKVPIVSVARGSTSPNQTLHVAMDEKQIGRDIAEWTAKKLGGKGKVAMLLGPERRADLPQSRRRLHRGDGEVSRHPDRVQAPTARSPASAASSRPRTRWSPIPTSRRSTPPTTTWRSAPCRRCCAANRKGKTLVTGMNGVPPALRAVKDGKLAMTVELNPVLWGRLGVDVLAHISQGRQGRAARVHQARHHRQDQHRREAAEDLRASSHGRRGSRCEARELRLRRRARSGEPASAVGPLTSASRRSSRRPRTRRSSGAGATSSRSLHRAVAEVPIDDIERRALIMVESGVRRRDRRRPATCIAAFTVLDPGDRARPHRHTFAAIRFATRADGAATIVNGRRCEMQRGRPDPHAADVLARPYQRERPPHHLVRRRQHAADPRSSTPISSSPAIRKANEFWQVDEGDEKLWAEAGPGRRRRARTRPTHSPKYRYSGAATRRLLGGAAAGPDGARTVRYTNPATGGAVMPALDCYAVRLPRAQPTRPKRTHLQHDLPRGVRRGPLDHRRADASNGRSTTCSSIPHWTFASHTAKDGDADLFIVSDKVGVRAPRPAARGTAIAHAARRQSRA